MAFTPKHPDIHVPAGSGNAFAIIGSVQAALKRAGVPRDEVKQFVDEATSGDYDKVLQTAMRWVNFG